MIESWQVQMPREPSFPLHCVLVIQVIFRVILIQIKHPRHVDMFRCFLQVDHPLKTFQQRSYVAAPCFSFFIHSLYYYIIFLQLSTFLHDELPVASHAKWAKHETPVPECKLAAQRNEMICSRCSPRTVRTLRTLRTSRRETRTCCDRLTRWLDVRLI